MPELGRLPWGAPVSPGRTVGWVFQAGPEERPKVWVKPGAVRAWEDASTSGKESGQPVLFLQRGAAHGTWIGWGRILPVPERWRAYEVHTVCTQVIAPPLDVVDAAVDPGVSLASENSWENRALGAALGLLRYRERTPFREVGARDLRLTSSDLHLLGRAQPRLRELTQHHPSAVDGGRRGAASGRTMISTGPSRPGDGVSTGTGRA